MATLVVGDGNFSFSLCLARRGCTEKLISTSLETEEQITQRPVARENVSELRKLGVYVFHGVDATKLDTDIQLKDYGAQYATIIFNFPHTGGKSNIKCNRQLLHDFFTSAARVLSPRGRVRVTLCKGQGGTPVDSIQRGHQNSWRVVEMAAEAGLLLTNVQVFDPLAYPGYECTGYRGGGKGFVLDGALEHVFSLPQPDHEPWEVGEKRMYEVCQYCCGSNDGPGLEEVRREMREKGMDPVSLLTLPWHPVTRAHQLLVRALGLQAGQGLWGKVESEVEERVRVDRGPSDCCPSYCEGDIWWNNGGKSGREKTAGGCSIEREDQSEIFMLQSSPSQLLPSLLAHTRHSCSNPGPAVLYTVTAPLVRETVISPNPSLQPISHSLCGFLPLPHSSQTHSTLFSLRHSVILALKSLLPHLTLTSLTSSAAVQSVWTPSCDDVTVSLASGETATLATFHQKKWEEFLTDLLTFTVSLDTLAMAVYGLPHISLLWCRDRRFSEQFNKELDVENVVFKPFSLFAPEYTHDISFWVPPSPSGGGEGEREVMEVEREVWRAVRGVAGLSAVRVEHLETYREVEEKGEEVGGVGGGGEDRERVSQCYRVWYSSPGSVLSGTQTRDLQLRVRQRLASQVPGLELR